MESVNADLLIRNGTVIDPAQGLCGPGQVAIRNGKFLALPDNADVAARTIFDASGCLVVPGLVDFHCHFYFRSTFTGLNPDLAFLCTGVTTAVDQGSSGLANFRNFMDAMAHASVKFRAFMQVSAPGQSSIAYAPEPYVPERWDRDAFRAAMEYGGERFCGLKMRASRNAVLDGGERIFHEAVRLAEDLHTRLVVHIPDPPMPQSHIARALRPGDAMSHIFHGRGHTIYENGRIAPEIRRAQERGVFMDIAHGGVHLSYEVARRAIGDGFFPDTISTDQVVQNWLFPEVYNLNYVMSQLLALGMSVPEIIRAVTATPAKAAGLEGRAGSMAPGLAADVVVFKLVDTDLTFINSWQETLPATQLFVPQAVFLDGDLVYKPLDSCLRRHTAAFGDSL